VQSKEIDIFLLASISKHLSGGISHAVVNISFAHTFSDKFESIFRVELILTIERTLHLSNLFESYEDVSCDIFNSMFSHLK
jgi:hypothetical protein